MTGDYSRWLENEVAMVLTTSPPDPFARIPSPDDEYAGTVLETASEREARAEEAGDAC